ncbi:NYN domain-containing protein [Mesorhizobium sp. M1307]|uniref:NYN domain-containing protein n=1 Tax=unclassified Mesorhizobium TaxID=325217 RepID=UPI0033366654
MTVEMKSPRLAVLIDAENASAKIADGLFEEIAKIGEASVRRIYGDFSGSRLKAWSNVVSKHAIQQQYANATGKNASDIALVIDAMDLLHSGRFDGFCLVSSDSDFTRLAARIREQGVDVFGFGEQKKAPESFRQACRRFIYTENLLPTAPANSPDAAQPAKPLQLPSAATPIIRKVIKQMENEDGWVPLGAVGNQLANLASDFDPRTFGFRKLSDLVRKTNAFEIEQLDGRVMRIRVRSATASKPEKSA